MSQKQIDKKNKKRKEVAKKRVLSRRKQIREEKKNIEEMRKQIELEHELKNGKIKPIVKEEKFKNINVEKRVKIMKKNGKTPIIFVGEKVNSSF
jgi:hypothetical protein